MVRFGIVGTGIMGKLYARLISEHPQAELKAVAGITRESVQELAEGYAATPYLKHREMFNSGEIDAVYIATPDFAHYEIARDALEAGLHILLEKPMTTNLKEATALAALAEDKPDLKAMMRFGNRWSPPFVHAKKAIEDEKIGAVLSISGSLNDTLYVPTKMIKWSYMTTPGWFLMSHSLDLAWFLLKKRARSVHATGVKKKLLELGIDTYDLVHAQVVFEDGRIGNFQSGWIYPNSMPTTVTSHYEIVGEKGSIFINMQQQTLTIAEKEFKFPAVMMAEIDGKLEGYLVYTLTAFIRSIEEDLSSPVPLRDGLENVRILDAVHRSLVSGEIVQLP